MQNAIDSIINDHFFKLRGLIAEILSIFILFSTLDQFFKEFYTSSFNRVIIYVAVLIIYSIIWQIIRTSLPKCDESKYLILISIGTDNQKQQQRIKNDLFENINEILKEHNLHDRIQVIIPKPFQTENINKILYKYSNKQAELIKENNLEYFKKTSEFKKWNKMNKRINGKLYMWGKMKERCNMGNTYMIDANYLVSHPEMDISVSKIVFDRPFKLMPTKINIEEKVEVFGFKLASNQIVLHSRHVIGITLFLAKDYYLAYKFHKDLDHDFSEAYPGGRDIGDVIKKIKYYQATELMNMALKEYEINGRYDDAMTYIVEAEKIYPNDYAVSISYSYLLFNIKKDQNNSLRYLDRAKILSNGDSLWLYNKAFILMYFEKFERALEEYDRIFKIKDVDNEILEICIEYCNKLYLAEPNKKQILFVLGVFYYKRNSCDSTALKKFDSFLNETRSIQKYEALKKCTELYLKRVNKKAI